MAAMAMAPTAAEQRRAKACAREEEWGGSGVRFGGQGRDRAVDHAAAALGNGGA